MFNKAGLLTCQVDFVCVYVISQHSEEMQLQNGFFWKWKKNRHKVSFTD